MKLMTFLINNLSEIFGAIKDGSIIVGVVIAILNFSAQNRQKRIDNAFSVVKVFRESINDEDVDILKSVYRNTYESLGAKYGFFIYYDDEDDEQQEPISNLFIHEGEGLSLSGKLGDEDDNISKTLDPDEINTELGSVRHIAERLEILAYEVMYGQVEFRVVYFELGGIMQIIYYFIDTSIATMDEWERSDLQLELRFKNFLFMRKKYEKTIEELPENPLVRFA